MGPRFPHRHPGWLVLTLVALALGGCLRTLYEPAWCSEVETRVVAETDSTITYETRCVEWTAFSDSTKRWDETGQRLP